MEWTELEKYLIETRRDIHKHAEQGWTEFRTTSIVADTLSELGFEVKLGKDIIAEDFVLGRPEDVNPYIERALSQGAKRKWIDLMGGFTGAVGILSTGKPGPTVAFRFDMDALPLSETEMPVHRPFREGFVSVNKGSSHSCGHDANTANGLGLSKVLSAEKAGLRGRFKLIFQPAEEGVRGARAIVEKGVLDDVDYFVATHLGLGNPTGKISTGAHGWLCSTKCDVLYKGKPAHAGACPNEGNNALLAAATAVLNLHAIAPHKAGISRINVGVLNAGSGRNVVPAAAKMIMETRGATDEVAAYMNERAEKILLTSADMYGVKCDIRKVGEAQTAVSDLDFSGRIAGAISGIDGVEEVENDTLTTGSDDATWMMKRVQSHGGKATYITIGSDLVAPHHDPSFDIDESVLLPTVKILKEIAFGLCRQ